MRSYSPSEVAGIVNQQLSKYRERVVRMLLRASVEAETEAEGMRGRREDGADVASCVSATLASAGAMIRKIS